jgi:hypothetical protein
MRLTKESKSVLLTQNSKLKKLFCTCGYVGKSGNFNSCPKCLKEADIKLLQNGIETLACQNIRETENKIISTITLYCYKNGANSRTISPDYEKWNFRFYFENYKIIMDKITGDIWVERDNDKLELPFRGEDEDIPNKIHFFYKELPKFHNILTELFSYLLKQRKIGHIDYTSYIKNKNIDYLFLLVRFPALQFIDTDNIVVPKDEEIIHALKHATGRVDLLKRLTGHSSKNIRYFADNNQKLNFLILWGKHIKEPENFINFSSKSTFSKHSRNSLFGSFALYDVFQVGINLIKTLHHNMDERVWIKRLIKTSNSRYSYRNSNFELSFDSEELYRYVCDIGNMYKKILQRKNDYVCDFDGDIKKLHDHLSLDLDKLQKENQKIPYSDEERKLEKTFNKNKSLILAPDTHYLVEVGTRMRICVGSYGEDAISKDCDILVLKENNEPVVCIEVRNRRLIQAKMKFNYPPTKEYKKEIIEWCKEKEIKYENCYDIA